MTGQREHLGEVRIWNSSLGIRYRECWCGNRWIVTPLGPGLTGDDLAARWCPSAPVGIGTQPLSGRLLMSITELSGVLVSPFVVRACVRGMSTPVAFCASLPRALITAHAFYKTFAVSPAWTGVLMDELRRAR